MAKKKAASKKAPARKPVASGPDEEDVIVDWLLKMQMDAYDEAEDVLVGDIESENVVGMLAMTRERRKFLPNRLRLVEALKRLKEKTEAEYAEEPEGVGADSGQAAEADEGEAG